MLLFFCVFFVMYLFGVYVEGCSLRVGVVFGVLLVIVLIVVD